MDRYKIFAMADCDLSYYYNSFLLLLAYFWTYAALTLTAHVILLGLTSYQLYLYILLRKGKSFWTVSSQAVVLLFAAEVGTKTISIGEFRDCIGGSIATL
jgi:hypothetical protein